MTPGADGAAWWEMIVEIPDAAAEALTNFLWEQGAVGVVEEETPGAPAQLRAFFPATAGADTLAGRVDGYLAALRALGHTAATTARLAPLADDDWTAAWREHFRPVAVGRRLVVLPPWEMRPPGDRLPLVIEPGRAFGTGHHGTTGGCLTLLETVAEREHPARAIDLGTGSGILAVAAVRLGIARVLACDTDPDAVAAACANAERNGVRDRVDVVLADARALAAEPAPLVLANLLAAAHRALGVSYRRLVAPGGVLIAGGILDVEAEEVARALGPPGFAVEAEVHFDGWTTLALRHAPLHGRA